MTCFTTPNVAGPCGLCPVHPEPMHVTDEPGIYCAEHCPIHKQVLDHDWAGVRVSEPMTQGRLWES